jgi:DNA-binding protein HU-beta
LIVVSILFDWTIGGVVGRSGLGGNVEAMKKSELVDALAGASGQSKAAVSAVIDALGGVVLAGLRSHGTVTVPGVAKIDVRKKAPRTVRNPATGAAVQKPASTAAAFKPVKSLKDEVAAFEAG